MNRTLLPGAGPALARLAERLPRFDWQRYLAQRALASLGDPAIEIELPDGRIFAAGPRMAVARVRFRTGRALLQSLRDPDLGFGDCYSAGDVEVDRLAPLLDEMFRRRQAPPRRRPQLAHRNSPALARDNIHHHYDIGNEFYKLWLDEQLLYTCAYFADPGMTLEAAQIAKMDHVCRKLRLRSGDNVVEAGCGWGALSLHMARHYGVRVRAFNISHEQIVHARRAAAASGLTGRVEFVEDDYRNVSGRYDAFVSVGMLEHVGVANYRGLGALIDRCLTPDGRGLIHTIGRHRPLAMSRWIEARIFPGAEPPALSEMMSIFEPYDLAILDVENLRLHYGRTLEHWLSRYERAVERVRAMFDERFVRMWRLYLASSAAAFNAGWYQLYQVLFNRFPSNDVAWTRAHLYAGGA